MRSFSLGIVLFFVSTCCVFSMINVSPLIIDFNGATPDYQDIKVKNLSDKTAYVDVSLRSRTVKEGKVQVSEPIVGNSFHKGLVLSKDKLVIAPRAFVVLRAMSVMKNPSHDHNFDIVFTQVPDPFKKLKPPAPLIQVTARFNVVYDVQAFIRPLTHPLALDFKRQNTQLDIANKGKSNVLFEILNICKGNACQEEEPFRLYASEHKTLTLPFKPDHISYEVFDGKKSVKQNKKWS